MRISHSSERGAVLIVALIMLAMVTFLVVAFVGFARFERASVSASLRRTEVTFISGGSLRHAQRQAVDSITKDLNGTSGLLVSQRSGTNEFVPVYIDKTGDGVQDFNSTYLDLNSEINPLNQAGDPFGQKTDITRRLYGDPEWIGLLEDKEKPHGPGNRFIARTAYMTVAASQALNVRYNHNNSDPKNWVHERRQGQRPRSIDLAPPLYHINPDTFRLQQYNPYKYTGGMYELGGAIGSVMDYGYPTTGYSEVIKANMSGQPNSMAYAAAQALNTSKNNDSLYNWFRVNGGGKRPYGFYRFMETFSSVELPEEKGGFDISTIRDEVTYGYAFLDQIPGSPSPDEGHVMRFLDEHGLKDGDKLELAGLFPPHIVDPISFHLISPSLQTAQTRKDLWVQLFGSGGPIQTLAPHRLIGTDAVQLVITGVTQNLRLVRRAKSSNPWQLVPANLINTSNSGYWSMGPGSIGPSNTDSSSLSLPFARLAGQTAWASWNANTGQWIPQLNISTPDPMEVLPAGLQNAECKLVYRHTYILADTIPYFVKVHDRTSVSLHRSAQLDGGSRVRFSGLGLIPPVSSGPRSLNSVGDFTYDVPSGIFTCVTPRNPRRFVSGDYVLVENAGVMLQPQNNALGGEITPKHVFQLNSVGPIGKNDFILKIVEGPYKGTQVKLAKKGALRLRLVYPFKMDGLTASVEKMAGAMLNESLDVNELTAPKEHMLGGQVLPVPDPASPFPLEFGLGGHQEAIGPWHKPDAGIPWGRGSGSGFSGKGSFANEVERIIQVAANIGDIYSEPPVIEVSGKDVVHCLNLNTAPLLSFGAARSDGHVSAQIRYVWSKQNKAGIDFHPYRVVFEPAIPLRIYNNILEGTIKLGEWDSAKSQYMPRAQSAACKVKLVSGDDNGGGWGWKLNKFVWSDGLNAVKQPVSWVGFGLSIERESGRFVKVHLDGRKVIDYESPVRVASGQARLWATQNTRAYFTKLHPSLPNQTLQAAQSNGWTASQYTRPPNVMPTAYQGVFSKDNINNVYLSGLQRKSAMFAEDNLLASWYQRSSPKVIGVKDRGGVYAGRMPALNEVSLRATYNRNSNKLEGRLAVEMDVPFKGCRMMVTDLRVKGDVSAHYKRAMGDPTTPDVTFTIPSVAGGMASVDLNSTGLSAVALVNWPNLGTVPRVSGTGGTAKSLADIRLDNVQVSLKAQILDSNFRVVDFFDGTLSLPSASLGNPMGGHELFAPIWDSKVAAANGYGPGKINVVLGLSANPKFWFAANDVVPAPGSKGSTWDSGIDNIRKLRKVDISTQVNDPLVNSSEKGWQSRVYAPTYIISGGKWVPNQNETKVLWMPSAHVDPYIKLNTQYTMSQKTRYYFGVNLCRKNDVYQPWGASVGGNDYTIKDPGVGAHWWTFPDVSRNGIQNTGWLGQVHRGTPWQTLYLKSKEPGILNVTGFDDLSGILTVPSHRIISGSRVQLSGKSPLTWAGVQVGSSGNIAPGQLNGYAEVVSMNEIRLWPVPNASSWNAGQDVLSGRGPVPNTTGLKVQNLQYWKDWAGSEDTKPINDRRLLEAFYVSGWEKVRGRFSINNQRAQAWSGVLDGVSLPYVPSTGVPPRQKRVAGAYTPSMGGAERQINTMNGAIDTRWNVGILQGIGKVRGLGGFKRVTDILAAPELTDGSPYLPEVIGATSLPQYYNAPAAVDELDIERIPQQVLSLLKVGGRQFYQTYVFTEQLKPARRFVISAKAIKPGVRPDGYVDNYEVTSQSAKVVIFELVMAREWHESHKRGHFGKFRDENGALKDLPNPYPKVIGELPIKLDY